MTGVRQGAPGRVRSEEDEGGAEELEVRYEFIN